MTWKATGHHFDNAAADRAERFFESLTHVEGRLAGQPFELAKWQRTVVRDLVGWRREDGTRQYRIAYVEVPRKNGKTTWAAGWALYLLGQDEVGYDRFGEPIHEAGAQVYSCAGDRDQAGICYRIATRMVEQSEELTETFRCQPGYKQILHDALSGVYKVLSSDARLKHGYNPSGIIFDELHVQPNRELWDVMHTGRGARQQPLTVAITTAGHDRSSICWDYHCRAKSVLAGDLTDSTFYPVLFGADEDDDWTSPETWRKANPNLNVSVPESYLAEECERAQGDTAVENTFRNLYLNQWTEQAVRWLPMAAWDECTHGTDASDLVGRECYGGLDLSLSRDLSAFVLCFPLDELYAFRCWFWSPKDSRTKRDEQDKRQINNYGKKGLVTLTEGDTQDHRRITREIAELAVVYDIRQINADPNRSQMVMQELQDVHGLHVEKFQQTKPNYTQWCEQFKGLVTARQMEHFEDPVLRWNAGNVSLTPPDPQGLVMPNKGASASKIDGIVAAIMALAGAMRSEDVTWYTPGELAL